MAIVTVVLHCRWPRYCYLNMRTITDLSMQKNGKRVNVFLDGEYAFSLAKVAAASLRRGQTIEEARIKSLQVADAVEKGKQIAYGLLSYRPRSISEVTQHLRRKELSETIIEQVIDKLCDLDLLDDRAFARYWVDQRETFRPRSKRALRHELLQKGVSRNFIEETLVSVDEVNAALRVARKKARSYSNLPPADFKRKLGRFLGNRGFDYGVIAVAVKSIMESNDNYLPDDDTQSL